MDALGTGKMFVALPLEIVEMAGPIIFQQPRKRSIGEDFSLGLAARAIVGFMIGVSDPLHRRAAEGTRFAKPAVNGHPGTKRRDFLRNPIAGFRSQTVDPFQEHLSRGCVESLDLVDR